MSSFTRDLAQLATQLNAQDINPAASEWACHAFADTVACGLAGAGEGAVACLAEVLPGAPGSSMVFGSSARLHPLEAAQLNGVAAHALDFDDCNIEMDGHPSVSIVPALLAIADRVDCTGADLLTAYVAGVEAEIRIARVSNPAHADRGWHPTVTFGVIGAAIATGRLLELDASQMAIAIGIAASSAAGLRANSGTMTKPFHAGQANRNGLQATLLARAGMSANPDVLEHRFGFMAAFNGSIPPDANAVLADWGQDFALLSPGITIKQYPCCAFIHCAIDAASELSGQIKQSGADILAVRVLLHRDRLKNIDRPNPKDGLDAKFSTQYITARALLDGVVTSADFSPEHVFEPRTRSLAALVEIGPHTSEDLSYGQVEVVLVDGRRLQADARVAMGRGPENPMTPVQFKSKFMDCARVTLPEQQAENLFTALLDLPAQPSSRALSALMVAPANPSHASSDALHLWPNRND